MSLGSHEQHHVHAVLHDWTHSIRVAFVPTTMSPFLEYLSSGLLEHFRLAGHEVQTQPGPATDLILSTAPFGRPVSWREAPLFFARRRYRLRHSPPVYTLVHATSAEFNRALERLAHAGRNRSPSPADYDFPGLAPSAYRVLHEQNLRGGPLLALERLVQAQSKSLRILFTVGDERPRFTYHFDLVGAHPRSDGRDLAAYFEDMERRIVTSVSTEEVTEHEVAGPALPLDTWRRLTAPAAMTAASEQLGKRDFFTDPVLISDLVKVPAVSGAVASQYSEGCFATWEPDIDGLVATVTGSARPIHKGRLTEQDLAIITGVRDDGKGALVREVVGRKNLAPSSEAVEMIVIDDELPTRTLGAGWNVSSPVPVVRSKLHGHRGVSAFDPAHVEYVALDPAYQHYPVSCASEAQAHGVQAAFARSQALLDPSDPRSLVFTILPGHGLIIAEKWVDGTAPFQTIWEAFDRGLLHVDPSVPQGLLWYSPGRGGRLVLEEPTTGTAAAD